MKDRKVLLISLNSHAELTGGGHYLRMLVSGYRKYTTNFSLVCKKNNNDISKYDFNLYEVKKNIFSDFIARCFLSPTFLFFYFFKIMKLAFQNEIIVFHSSRCGILLLFLRIFLWKKKFIVHFDNVESSLIKGEPITFRLKSILTICDRLLIPLSEWICVKLSNYVSFITKKDQEYLLENSNRKSSIIPICYKTIDTENDKVDRNKIKYYLFTASFDFYPNKSAFDELLNIAECNKGVIFKVAGRQLDLLVKNKIIPSNVIVISDVSPQEMDELFLNAFCYISPVRLGSGMKTKLAEALRFGLPIIATKESLIGYEDVAHYNCIYMYEDFLNADKAFSHMERLDFTKSEIRQIFQKYYSLDKAAIEIKKMCTGGFE